MRLSSKGRYGVIAMHELAMPSLRIRASLTITWNSLWGH